jgi:hypothetical protein
MKSSNAHELHQDDGKTVWRLTAIVVVIAIVVVAAGFAALVALVASVPLVVMAERAS